MEKKVTLIACSIFQEELEHILKQDQPGLTINWLEVGLHENIERLEEELDRQLEV